MKNIFSTFGGPGFGQATGPDFGPAPGPADDRSYLFVILSVVLHALVLLTLTTIPKDPVKSLKEVERPLDIEIVEIEKKTEPSNIDIVELPPLPPEAGELKRPKEVSAYAQRDQTVEREEYPEFTGRQATLSPPSQAAKQSIIIVEPEEGRDGEGEEAKAPGPPVRGEEAGVMEKAVKAEAPNDADDDNESGGVITLKSLPGAEAGAKKSGAAPGAESAAAAPHDMTDGGGEGGEGTGRKAREGFALIPTDTTLQQIARQEETGVESPKTGSGMTLLLNTSDFKFQKYFIAVKRRIEFYWDYPPLAARNGQQGRLKIDFTIQKDGSIRPGDINIIKSSNYPVLDDAATTALRLASPFNPFPEGFDTEEITVHGSFEYSLYRGR